MTLEELYELALNTPSDINLHLPILRNLASECSHVTEFGMRGGVSTTALLAAQPDDLVSYDINYCPVADRLRSVAGACRFVFHIADTSSLQIDPTDMLFIDTLHVGPQLTTELINERSVRRYIAMHDTATFGLTGEGGGPGLQASINQFLDEHPEWVIMYRTTKNNGLTVLERPE